MNGRFSRYEAKVKLSIMLMLLILVISNFASSFLFKRTQELFLAYHSINQRQIAGLCKNALFYSSGNPEALNSINTLYGEEYGIAVEIIRRIDFESGKITGPQFSKARLKDGFDNVESYEFHPDAELHIGYIPFEVNPQGKVESLLILKSRIGWFSNFSNAARWDNIFRLAGIASVIIFGILVIRMITRPYSNIRILAASTLNDRALDIDDPDDAEKAFDEVVNELKRKETELRQMTLRDSRKTLGLTSNYDYIFGGISSGVIVIDKEGVVIRFNPSASGILELEVNSILGREYEKAFAMHPEIKHLIRNALEAAKTYSRVEINLLQRGGRNKTLGATSSLITNENRQTIGVAILLLDLTQIKKIESETSYREKMAALGEMSAGMAHEIRNSAAAISGFGKLISKFADDAERVRSLSGDIVKESREMETLMRKFLAFARPVEISKDTIEICGLINDCINYLKTSNEYINIRKIISPVLPSIMGDYQLIKQCLCNILKNAQEASNDNGEIVIKAVSIRVNSPDFIQGRATEYIKIVIADSGKGIESEYLKKIFDPFVTDKDHGSGLGLAIVRKIIALHNGIVKVHSRSGKGTLFSIYLPIENKEQKLVENGIGAVSTIPITF